MKGFREVEIALNFGKAARQSMCLQMFARLKSKESKRAA